MSDWKERQQSDTICLFDVDGTITPARLKISQKMMETLQKLKTICVIGFVGGSDLAKQEEQLGKEGLALFDYKFAENGLTAYRKDVQLESQSFIKWIGEEKYQKLVNFILNYIAQLQIPKKRGTFVEFRNGMINVSPIGRNCSHEERNEFEEYDKKEQLRMKMVEALRKEFPDYGLRYSIGGQISFDVFPEGWDKTYCLRHLKKDGFKTVHFFGDKTFPGGNDYEIYTCDQVTGHSVKSPEDTMGQLKSIFKF